MVKLSKRERIRSFWQRRVELCSPWHWGRCGVYSLIRRFRTALISAAICSSVHCAVCLARMSIGGDRSSLPAWISLAASPFGSGFRPARNARILLNTSDPFGTSGRAPWSSPRNLPIPCSSDKIWRGETRLERSSGMTIAPLALAGPFGGRRGLWWRSNCWSRQCRIASASVAERPGYMLDGCTRETPCPLTGRRLHQRDTGQSRSEFAEKSSVNLVEALLSAVGGSHTQVQESPGHPWRNMASRRRWSSSRCTFVSTSR